MSSSPPPFDVRSSFRPEALVLTVSGEVDMSTAPRIRDAIEAATGLKAKCNFMPMQDGDVPETFADTSLLRALTGFSPKMPVAEGVKRFVAWYRDYFGV